MATHRDAVPPDLAGELKEIKRRLAANERRPDPMHRFDRYPTVEWSAVGRGRVTNNVWSSCGIADVTGLVYDRVEIKFLTDRLITGEREAYVRLAAFKHSGNAEKTCVAASNTLELTGLASSAVGTVLMRWVHGIPFGWDYADDVSTYTIELQHKYKTGPTPPVVNRVQMYGMWKMENDPPADEGGGTDVGSGRWVAYQAGSNRSPIGYVTIPAGGTDTGTYSISNMHYCVGLPPERLRDASPSGWAWVSGSNVAWGSAGNINDPFLG